MHVNKHLRKEYGDFLACDSPQNHQQVEYVNKDNKIYHLCHVYEPLMT